LKAPEEEDLGEDVGASAFFVGHDGEKTAARRRL
jgi:hypothetical protein